ncbi:MAG: AAA family ATPase [bacterium]
MTNAQKFMLYQGQGVPIRERNLELPLHEPFIELEKPETYIAELGLRNAINVALALGQPLLLTGEPGTGKTQLAGSVTYELGLPAPLVFNTKTTSTATDLFYQYDALRRFQDAQIKEQADGKRIDLDPEKYIIYQALGLAIFLSMPPDKANPYLPDNLRNKGPIRSVVLIDEIDKAPRDLPNDVLYEIERMSFTVKETGKSFSADPRYRPIVVLTSNSEKNLPDAFLRRCVYYHIPFPSEQQLKEIVLKRFSEYPDFTPAFIDAAIKHFYEIRSLALKKKPATAEFLAWLGILQSLKIDLNHLESGQAEAVALSYSILAKTREDLALMRKHILAKEGE